MREEVHAREIAHDVGVLRQLQQRQLAVALRGVADAQQTNHAVGIHPADVRRVEEHANSCGRTVDGAYDLFEAALVERSGERNDVHVPILPER